jgi:hypothetical protein
MTAVGGCDALVRAVFAFFAAADFFGVDTSAAAAAGDATSAIAVDALVSMLED